MKYLSFIISLILITNSCSESKPVDYGEILLNDLIIPWEIEIGPDEELWFTHQFRKLSKLNLTNQKVTSIEIIDTIIPSPNKNYSFGMTFHPDFKNTPWVYLSFLYQKENDPTTGLLSVKIYEYDAKKNTVTYKKTILKDVGQIGNWNAGGRIKTSKNYLFVNASNETVLHVPFKDSNLSGSILRYDLDGSIPQDNPIANSPKYTSGHRNPQGLVVLSDTEIYTSEHGPSTDDEFNKIESGKNYGWPMVHGYCDTERETAYCDTLKSTFPIKSWTPTIAVSSLDFYKGNNEDFKNTFWVTTLKEGDLRMLRIKDNKLIEEKIFLNEKYGRLRDLTIDKEGNIYISTANNVPSENQGYPKPNKDESIQYDVIVKFTPDMIDITM